MAEVLGIVGGIASLMGLLKQTGRVYDLCRHFKNGSVEIQNIAIETRMLRMTLDTFTSQLKNLEDQGCEIETLRSVILEASEKLWEIEESIKNCIDECYEGTKARAAQRLKFLFRRKKVEEQMLVLERMKITMMAAKTHFGR